MSDVRKPRYPAGPAKFGQNGWYETSQPTPTDPLAVISNIVWWVLILVAIGYAAALIVSNIWM